MSCSCRSATGVVAGGAWERLLQRVQAAADAAGEIDWDIAVDSMIVRAHRHAAGARTGPPPTPVSKGAEAAKHQAEGGAGDEGLGRSCGGFTSKLHLSADGRCRPLSLVVTGGQRADCTQFGPVLEKIRVPRPGPGRPRSKPNSLAAPIRPTATARAAGTCAAGASGAPSRRRPTARPPAGARAHAAAGLRASTRSGTEAQHRRTGDQQAEAGPGRGHSLRQTPLRLPRHRFRRSLDHLAPYMMGLGKS